MLDTIVPHHLFSFKPGVTIIILQKELCLAGPDLEEVEIIIRHRLLPGVENLLWYQPY